MDGKRLGHQAKSLVEDVALDHVAIVVAGHKQDVEVRLDLAEALHQHWTAHARHHDVHNGEIRAMSETVKCLHRTVRILRCGYLVAFFRKDRLQEAKDIRLIVDNQDGPAVGFRVIG